ncbi:uncharacterized protein BDR25DRAFT_357942 [Lindgomyces ingoldianus]|uniref:Uncharacterized protein n=1 Tax=Lindgomyces ingoldianus TaxID=673940 RepID=A0ACB6QMN4_9PLEO|nr:uncharacterized protein BDR25DRAFT_357942 [Lindgomyces ingoldianus]KAF2468198.1 hypothetical protein BDR25DRAFT_357942 [Lindgomyces ingoldianus]
MIVIHLGEHSLSPLPSLTRWSRSASALVNSGECLLIAGSHGVIGTLKKAVKIIIY